MSLSFRTALPALLAALALGACNTQDPTARLSLEESVAAPRLVALAGTLPSAPRIAAALPPEAGTIVGARSQAARGGVLEETALEGGAAKRVRDGITVAIPYDARGHGPALFGKPYEPAIRAELAAQYPGIAMQVVGSRPFANTYGPYGLALGRGDGNVHCLYAWQWIDDPQALTRAALPGPVGVRVRLCRDDRSFDELAAAVDHLILGRDAPSAIVAETAPPLEIVAEHHTATPRHRRRPGARRHATARHDTSAMAQRAAPAPQSFAEAPSQSMPAASALSMDLPAEAYRGPAAARARP